jgi:hypothetical protein
LRFGKGFACPLLAAFYLWPAAGRGMHRCLCRWCRAQSACPCPRQPLRGGSVPCLASPPKAAPKGPSCDIRCVFEHHYADGARGGSHPVEVRFFGKRGKPVKKMRFVPAAKAHEMARKLQGARGSTISVL